MYFDQRHTLFAGRDWLSQSFLLFIDTLPNTIDTSPNTIDTLPITIDTSPITIDT